MGPNGVVLDLVPLKKKTGQNDAVLACSSIAAPFSGLSQPETTPNRALASAVLKNRGKIEGK